MRPNLSQISVFRRFPSIVVIFWYFGALLSEKTGKRTELQKYKTPHSADGFVLGRAAAPHPAQMDLRRVGFSFLVSLLFFYFIFWGPEVRQARDFKQHR